MHGPINISCAVSLLWSTNWTPMYTYHSHKFYAVNSPCQYCYAVSIVTPMIHPLSNLNATSIRGQADEDWNHENRPMLLWTLCVYCCFYFRCRTAGWKSVFGMSCDRPHRHRFFWFPCVCKQMLRWFPRFQVATTCFSCNPPDLNLLVTNFIFCIHVK